MKNEKKTGVTRRRFVQVSAAGLAIAAAPGVMARPGESTRKRDAYPHRGTIFCTQYSASGRGWKGVRSNPAIGRYSSGNVGALDTQITLAKQYGLSFFLGESVTDDKADYRAKNLAKLYERGDLHHFPVAVLLTGFAPRKGVPAAAEADAWLRLRLQNLVSSGVLDRASYLRDKEGRAIVAVNAGTTGRDVAAAARRLFAETGAHESMWLWIIGDEASRPEELAPGIAWVAQPQPRSLRDALVRQGEVSLLSMSAETRGREVPAERLSAYAHSRYIVIDSFNDWKRRTALEPAAGGRSRSVFVASLGRQLDAVVR